MKEEFVQFALAQHASRFPERKERNESTKHDQGASQQLNQVPAIEAVEGNVSKHEPLNPFLEDVKRGSKYAEYERFVKCRHDKRLAFMSSTNVYAFA